MGTILYEKENEQIHFSECTEIKSKYLKTALQKCIQDFNGLKIHS